MPNFIRSAILAITIAISLAPAVVAQPSKDRLAPDFPPGQFSDGKKYQLSDFRGKVVVIFFYESNCPRCKGSIPERNEVVKAFQGKPVKFLGVGASDTFDSVTSYARETGLAMPIFADGPGLMEARYGQKISLQNIWQFRVIGPDGRVVGYDMDKKTIEKAMERAAWRFEPTDYDAKLKPALEAFEWGQWTQGMKLLSPLRKGANKPVADSANKLHDAVTKVGQGWRAEAAATQDPVTAYDVYTRISTVFAGEPLAKEVAGPLQKAAQDKAVVAELAARKAFEPIVTTISRFTPEQRQLLTQQLRLITKKHKGTPTGDKAEELAKELDSLIAKK